MDKNKTLAVSFGDKNTSKGITIETLEQLARQHEVSTDVFIQRLLAKKFQEMRPDEYERALIIEKATDAMDELSLKQFFKALIENALSDFTHSINYIRLNQHTYTYDKDGIKVVVEYIKGKGSLSEHIFNLYLGDVIDKDLLAKYKSWNHNRLSVRIPANGISRAKVIEDVKFADITFKFKY